MTDNHQQYEDRKRIESDHIGPMIVGDYEDVIRDAMAMSFHDAHFAVDEGRPYRGPYQHAND